MKYKAILWAAYACLLGCATPPPARIIAANCQSMPLPSPPEETRFSVSAEQPAQVIKAALVDLQNWKADALACRAVK